MITETVGESPTVRAPVTAAYLLKLLSGPVAFALVMMAPLALPYAGHVTLATFACASVWWMTQPIPWAIAAMLPFIVFPAAGVLDIAATMRLYGQPIFFWMMGTVLMGYAIEKHGLAHRIAVGFLAVPGISGNAYRLTFGYMLIVGLISVFVSDAATIAMTIPIGMSLVRHATGIRDQGSGIRELPESRIPDPESRNFATFMTLGTLYAAIAGGTATIIGVPHNAIVMAALQRITGRQLGFFEWMRIGVPIFVVLLGVFYAVLWIMTPPEIRVVPGGEAFLRAERAKLGPMTANQRRVLFVFASMVILFTLPAVTGLAVGSRHPLTVWMNTALNVWVIPPAVMFLLFTIRSADDPATGLLSWRDAERQSPWGAMLLVTGAVAMTDALAQFGFVEFMEGVVRHLGVTPTGLPYLAAWTVGLVTNFISGTAAAALFCNIFIPAAVQIGYNPASIAILIANVALGLVVPWAGATAATTFAAGSVEMKQMIRVGIVTTLVYTTIVATIHLMMARFI
jgi:solute carrier family 13 (sodium-dependent dicarboxylate transporter), member 2/3/5